MTPMSETVRVACPHDCPDTCAMLVTVNDGVATKIQGDPHAPFTEGTICTKVSHYLERTYSPDRLQHPMRRIGPKGKGLFERISWDEALDEIAARLKALAAGNPRIAFRDPVAPLRIVPESTHYDIGLFLLEPVNFNYEHALPNKIFEFIQARLAVAIGPSPEMARLVRRYDCGVVAPSFEPRAMAAALNALTPAEIDRLKANAHRAAKVHHAAENAARLRAIASSVLA